MKQTIRRKRHRETTLSNLSVLFWVYVAYLTISVVPYPFPLVAFLKVSIVSFIIGHLNMLKQDLGGDFFNRHVIVISSVFKSQLTVFRFGKK